MPPTVDEQSASQRRENLVRLMNDVILPQRTRLLQARDHTWQSAYVDDDGYLAELIASFVTGVPLTRRRGVSRSTGDLSDGTEVKKGYRVDPNVDFMLTGRTRRAGSAWEIELDTLPPELRLPDILRQLNKNACSVQVIRPSPTGLLGEQLWRTRGKDSLCAAPAGGHPFLRLTAGQGGVPPACDVTVCVRQERGHINFSDKTRAQLDSILQSKPVLVFYQHDVRGRFSIAVVQVKLSPREIEDYLNEVYVSGRARAQIQPYLFPDNIREALYSDSNHSVRDGLRGRLLAYGVQASSGFEFLHWSPEDPPLVSEMESLLIDRAPPESCPAFRHANMSLDWDSVTDRRDFAAEFFDRSVVGYNRALQGYCEMASSTRNIGFGNLSQHLAGICTGLRGTRSGARGKDLVEPDMSTPSEIKLATGQRGDAMGTEDMPRLTLGWDDEKMLQWKRLIAVRLVELDRGCGPHWHAMVHAPTQTMMQRFRRQVAEYFTDRVNNGSGGLQYHAREYPHHEYGTHQHLLRFECVGEFEEGQPAKFPKPMPNW